MLDLIVWTSMILVAGFILYKLYASIGFNDHLQRRSNEELNRYNKFSKTLRKARKTMNMAANISRELSNEMKDRNNGN